MNQELNIVIRARDRASSVFKDLGDESSKLTKKLQDAGNRMRSIGKKMTVGITTPIAAIGLASIKAASDLTESLNKANATFETSAEEVERWAERAADSFGLSNQAALEGASSIGAMLKPMGVAPDLAAKMSIRMAELAADMGSFNNEDPTEMLNRIRAGLSGESEPLKRFGAVLSETRVKAHAMAEGMVEGNEALTEQEKIMARYSLLLKDTADQQGDFGRTSDDTANKVRRMKARYEDLSAEFGDKLLPIANDVLDIFVRVLEKFESLSPGTQQLIIKIGALTAAIGPLLIVFGLMASSITKIVGLLKLMTGAMGVTKTATLGLGRAFAGGGVSLVAKLGLAGAAIGATKLAMDALDSKWQSVSDSILESSNKAVSGFQRIKAEFDEGKISADEYAESARKAADAANVASRQAFENRKSLEGVGGFLNFVSGGLTGSAFSRAAAEARQFGGPVSAGQGHVVGEDGPELFIPNTQGRIVDNEDSFGQPGNMTTNIYGNITLGDQGAVDRFFERLDRQQRLSKVGIS